jgi:hypothetical protein
MASVLHKIWAMRGVIAHVSALIAAPPTHDYIKTNVT